MSKNSTSDSISNYNVLNLIGRGGFGNVYKANVIKTQQVVAIKFIDKKQLRNHHGLINRVLQEVSIHGRLKHPSILELYSYFEDSSYIYLVLEYCANGDLQSQLKNQSYLLEDTVRTYLQQIVDGIIYLQRHRILHRDLTLSNLLLDEDMNIKIADFGLATQLDEPDDKHFTMCGTPNYISPEIANRRAHGLEADVWSIGCMMYTMLVGRPPFDACGVLKTLERVMHDDFIIPHHISTEAANLIKCLLQKNPINRIKLDQILSHKFFKRKRNNSFNVDENTSIDSGLNTFSTFLSSKNLSKMNFKDNLKEYTEEKENRSLSSCASNKKNGISVFQFLKSKPNSNVSQVLEMKKEKSTDCDSALIPLLCVHG